MLLAIDNPKVDISKAKNVYAMYTWLSRYNHEPQADLLRVYIAPTESVENVIEETASKPNVVLRGVPAKLHTIYVDNQENPTL